MLSRRLLSQVVVRSRPLASHVAYTGLRPSQLRRLASDNSPSIGDAGIANGAASQNTAVATEADGHVIEPSTPTEKNVLENNLYGTLLDNVQVAETEKAKKKRAKSLKLVDTTTAPRIRKKRSDAGTKRKPQLDEHGNPIIKTRKKVDTDKNAAPTMRKIRESLPSIRKSMPKKSIVVKKSQRVRYASMEPLAEITGHDVSDFEAGGVALTADRSRMNIMSLSLCDDVLERLGSSLDKHEGCDIIDINPGIGTWSSKLHDRLKPRTHILMEPDTLYEKKLGDLVKSNPESYKVLPYSGIIWSNLLKLEKEGHLPHQTFRRYGDPELEKPNDTLLVTINVGYWPRRSYVGFSSMAQLVVHQLITSTRAHSIFQAYGQVRMLVWMHDYEKRNILPRNVLLRKKSAIEAELSLDYLHEVCGAENTREIMQREQYLDIESLRRVSEKMEAAGVTTPEHRKGRLLKMIEEGEQYGSVGFYRSDNEEMAKLEEYLMTRQLAAGHHKETKERCYMDRDGKINGLSAFTFCRKHNPSPELARWLNLKYRITSDLNSSKAANDNVAQYEKIAEEYLRAYTSTDPDRLERMEAAKKDVKVWLEMIKQGTIYRCRDVLNAISERDALHQEPPLLYWDRREYEPLLVNKEEFHPPQEMCLLDIKPKTIWPVLRGNNLSDYDYFELLLSTLTMIRSESVVKRLQSVAPGADEWIIPRCPSLMDPTKGGYLDLEFMTTRSLNLTQLREIIEEFMKWPFRPSKGRLLQSAGSADLHEEAVMDDDALWAA